MRYLFIIFTLFSTSVSLCQNHIISYYEKYDLDNKGQNYSEALKLDDKNSLILKLNNLFIIYKTNGEILRISRGYLNDKKLYVNKIDELQKSLYKNILDTLKSINPSNLQKTKKEELEITINDGTEYSIELLKDNYLVDYVTYSPEVYIKEKFPFYKERIKFLKIIEKINNLFYDQEYVNINNRDKLYINTTLNQYENLKDYNIEKISDNFKNLYIFKSLENKILITDRKYIKSKPLKINSKIFLSENKESIIKWNFIDKYGPEFLNDKNKCIFTINQKSKTINIQLMNFR